MSLKEKINVTITRQTKAVSRAGFGVMAIVSPHVVFTDRLRYYTDVNDMITDGFESTDPAYLAANAALSQNPGPVKVGIGRQQVDVVGVSVDTVTDSVDYTVTVDGTDFVFTSGVATTDLLIAAGLVGLIDVHADYSATDDADGTFTVSHTTAGTAFTVSVDTKMSLEKPFTSPETVTDALTAIAQIDNDWYGLVWADRTQADVELAAAWTASNGKLFITASDDVKIYDAGDATDIASILQAASHERTAVMFHETPAQYPDAAWLGLQLATDPGSSTWAYKTLTGITFSPLSTSQSTAVQNKNGNTYELIGGVNVTFPGKVASGSYIDDIRGADWLEARITERVFGKLVNLPKVPHTDPGYGIVEAEIYAQLDEGIDAGYLVDDPAPVVSVPLSADVSSGDKIARTLNDVTFTAYLAGAVHTIQIDGVVTI